MSVYNLCVLLLWFLLPVYFSEKNHRHTHNSIKFLNCIQLFRLRFETLRWYDVYQIFPVSFHLSNYSSNMMCSWMKVRNHQRYGQKYFILVPCICYLMCWKMDGAYLRHEGFVLNNIDEFWYKLRFSVYFHSTHSSICNWWSGEVICCLLHIRYFHKSITVLTIQCCSRAN